MSKLDIEKIKQGIFCCIFVEGYSCNKCPYQQFNKEENCQLVLKKDIDVIFFRFEILNDNE